MACLTRSLWFILVCRTKVLFNRTAADRTFKVSHSIEKYGWIWMTLCTNQYLQKVIHSSQCQRILLEKITAVGKIMKNINVAKIPYVCSVIISLINHYRKSNNCLLEDKLLSSIKKKNTIFHFAIVVNAPRQPFCFSSPGWCQDKHGNYSMEA